MDQQKIIHLAGEVVVIGGVFLYLNKQIKSLRQEIEDIQNVMIKQQEFIEKNFAGISKSIDFLMRSKQVPMQQRKQKINITPLPVEDEEHYDAQESNIINNSQNNVNVENVVPTLNIQSQQEEIEHNIDDITDVNEELNLIANTNIEPIIDIVEEEKKEEEIPISIEVKQPELIQVKEKKKKVKK
jgi:hypothetical protein